MNKNNAPEIKVISLSNVFTKSMHFVKKGDVMNGHTHTYDHATLISHGEALVELLDEHDKTISAKIYKAPNMVYIPKNNPHRITALTDNTVVACIHALRTIDEELILPDSITTPVQDFNEVKKLVAEKYGVQLRPFLQKNTTD